MNTGRPVMIPGSREVRVAGPDERVAGDGIPSIAPSTALPAAISSGDRGSDRARIERAREGGGAVSERSGARRPGVMALLERWISLSLNLLRPAPAVVTAAPASITPADRSS